MQAQLIKKLQLSLQSLSQKINIPLHYSYEKCKSRELVIYQNTHPGHQSIQSTEFWFGGDPGENCTQDELEKFAMSSLTLYAGAISFNDLVVELANGRKSEKMGAGKGNPLHSVLKLNT